MFSNHRAVNIGYRKQEKNLVARQMKKQSKRKILKVQHPIPQTNANDENSESSNMPHSAFVQAKPSLEFNGPDLSGTWKTCGQDVHLQRYGDSDSFEGHWGVHILRFQIDGTEIQQASLGAMELMFGGTLSAPNRIEWGNGQIWLRS